MNRASFLKALAALGVSPSIIKAVEIESENDGLEILDATVSTRYPEWRVERIGLKVPKTLDIDAWEKIGLLPEDVNELARKSYLVHCQAHARQLMRDPSITREQIEEAANNWVPRKRGERPVMRLSEMRKHRISFTPEQLRVLSRHIKIVE